MKRIDFIDNLEIASGVFVGLLIGAFTFATSVPQVPQVAVPVEIAPPLATSVLPTASLAPIIRDMRVGDSGYTEYWAVSQDSQRQAVIDGSYEITATVEGTSDTRVTRVSGGFRVCLPAEASYDPADLLPDPHPGYYSVVGFC